LQIPPPIGNEMNHDSGLSDLINHPVWLEEDLTVIGLHSHGQLSRPGSAAGQCGYPFGCCTQAVDDVIRMSRGVVFRDPVANLFKIRSGGFREPYRALHRADSPVDV
jgi:hypothetical protein